MVTAMLQSTVLKDLHSIQQLNLEWTFVDDKVRRIHLSAVQCSGQNDKVGGNNFQIISSQCLNQWPFVSHTPTFSQMSKIDRY